MSQSLRQPLLVELHVPDFEGIVEFYEKLGFTLIRAEERYLVLQNGDSLLHFYLCHEHHPPHHYFANQVRDRGGLLGVGVELIIFSETLQKAHDLLAETNAVLEPIQKRPWGAYDFRVQDPNGYYLRISEPYDTRVDWLKSLP